MPEDQPLNGQNVTEGSAVVLPGYPVAFISVGLLFLGQNSTRTSGPAFDSAKWLLGWTPNAIYAWGTVFLLIGGIEGLAWLTEKRTPFKWLLVVGCGVVALWATLLLWSATNDPVVSFTGSIWLYFIAWCHIASIRSLTRDLVFKR